jgi:UPF0755 protein
VLLIVVAFLLMISAIVGYRYYHINYASNITTQDKPAYLYIYVGAEFDEVLDSLRNLNVLHDEESFIYVARRENYPDNIHAGRFKLVSGMSNKTLVRVLLLGSQEPVRLTLSGNIRTNQRLAALVSRYIEPDSLEVLAALNDTQLTGQYGFTPSTVMGMFIPNTYEVYWGTSVKALLQRMKKEYDVFWDTTRCEKAAALGMTPKEVTTLASIVYEESLKTAEMPRIAGVYINRLRKGIPLQADPTLKYATGDFAARRVLSHHKNIESPYNTYKNAGLPPGPICIPPPVVIDAVLNYEVHSYLYFCAKADFSGYHSFSKTLTQHNEYAREYQQALSQAQIYR